MSASAYKLLLYLCVWTSILQANAIQNLRYPTRLDKNQWRFGKRQDFLSKSRFFIWNPALGSPQMYPNIKAPLNSHTFNRWVPPPPPMTAIHHQNYMFALPTKVNYPIFAQPVKEIDEKRKPGNLHHITIINAIMPKPYLPTSPTHNHNHPTSTFRNYRTNNKLLYTQQYFNNNNFARQNVENLNKLTNQHVQLQHLQQHQPQPLQMVYTSSPSTVKINTPTMEHLNVVNYNTKMKNIDFEENEISNSITKCGRKTKEDSNNSASDVLYYYCNNRITNYKNPTQQLFNIPSTTTTTTSTSTSTTSSTTTTTEAPATTNSRTTAKSLDTDFNYFTTDKPSIFLPTPNAPLENSFTPIASAFRGKNSLNDLEYNVDDNFKHERQKSRFNKYEDNIAEIQQQRQRQRQRQTFNSYESIKRQQHYTTTAPPAYDNMKLHSFFTIEDAVTPAPEMQVFNDPYQAYRHARRHHNNKHLKQAITTTKTTTSKEPYTTTFTTKPKFKSFFDELDDDEYVLPENTAQYDYSLYNKPQKITYFKTDHNNEKTFSKPNQILDHTYKPTVDSSFLNEGDIYLGKPKIKEHHFGLFKALASTSTPAVTTYKPYDNLRNLFLTTPKVTNSFTYNPKPISFTTTTETILKNAQGVTETENTTLNIKSNEIRTTTIIPITTTAKKPNRISLKSPFNLRSTNTFKYTKPRGIQKSYKNLNITTTTTTTKATPTLKKSTKYQRQYKGKKLKQFKHLYTTTSTTSTTTTTTELPTTVETATKRQTLRLIPTTTSATTEEPITKKINKSRTATTETIRNKKSRQPITIPTEAPIRNKVKNIRTSTTLPTITNNYNSSTRRPSHRRGTKRSNISRNQKETKATSASKTENKSRRRLSVSSSSTTPKSNLTRPTFSITSTSTTSTTTAPSLRKSSLPTTTSTTTMKSIMRIANSKSRTKTNNEIKTPIKLLSNEVNDERLFSSTATSSPMASIPPLPIEIYFKKSHNAKI